MSRILGSSVTSRSLAALRTTTVLSLRAKLVSFRANSVSFRANSVSFRANSVSFRAKSRNLHLTLFLLFPLFTAQAQTAEQTLFKLENDFVQAVIKRDPKGLEKLTAPKWVYSDESGVMNRAEGIKVFTSGTDTVKTGSNENMKAFVYGNSAVVIGILRLKGSGPKGAFDNRYRYTDAWALIDGQWRCIGSQDYLIPAKR